MTLHTLRRIVGAAMTAQMGIQLHRRRDAVLRSTIHLVVFDAVALCVSRLYRTAATAHRADHSRAHRPEHTSSDGNGADRRRTRACIDDDTRVRRSLTPLVTLVALTADFMSALCAEDVKLLRASRDSVVVIASMFRFSYLWLAGVPWLSLEAVGMTAVATVLRSVTLLSHLTLMQSRWHRHVVRQAMRVVMLRLPCRRPRIHDHNHNNNNNNNHHNNDPHHNSHRSPVAMLRVADVRRGGMTVSTTPRQRLLLFLYLTAWSIYLTADTSDVPSELPAAAAAAAAASSDRDRDDDDAATEALGGASWVHAVYTLLDVIAMLLLTPVGARHSRRVEDTYICQSMREGDAYSAEAAGRASDAHDATATGTCPHRPRSSHTKHDKDTTNDFGAASAMHAIPFSLHDLTAMTHDAALVSSALSGDEESKDGHVSLPQHRGPHPHPHRTVTTQAVMGRLARGAAAVLMCLMRGRTLALVKNWFDTLERKLQQLVYDFVERNIAPVLIRRSLESVWAHSPDAQRVSAHTLSSAGDVCGDRAMTSGSPRARQFRVSEYMMVQLSAAQRCVVVSYEKEDMKLSMKIAFPPAYPLRPASIEPISDRKSSGVPVERRRLWVLKMSVRLFGGSTNVWECVELLRRNLDAHFEGIEPCPICYLVVSTSDQKLPSMTCTACHNTPFHASCLYRWWSNGGKTECPLCRAPWIAE